MPNSSHELLSLPKTNMKKEGSGNVTGLKFESRTRTQSRTRSPIQSSLLLFLLLLLLVLLLLLLLLFLFQSPYRCKLHDWLKAISPYQNKYHAKYHTLTSTP